MDHALQNWETFKVKILLFSSRTTVHNHDIDDIQKERFHSISWIFKDMNSLNVAII